jgi:DNA-binding winged helix-turn-helix (wHTH) protein/TolB-like protein/Flp pilus assembly protein TadD
MINDSARRTYEFGPFRLDPTEGQLWRGSEEVVLTQKALKVLMLLVEQSGHILEKNELMEKVWPDAFVEENRLADNISTLRKALGDDPKSPRFIKTVPGRGYRFVADVREVSDKAVALVQHTRTHIIIEEEHAPPESSDSNEHAFRERAVTPALPAAGARRQLLNPAVIALAFVLLVALAVAAYFGLRSKTGQSAGQAPLARSIAVLPFKPLVTASADPALEMGMTDALIAKLSNIKQIAVRPTTSVMKYTGERLDLRAVGAELGVDMLLDGTLQKAGDRIRLSVQLVRTSDGTPIWADKFDKEFTDIFAVQDEISEKVASKLALRLSGEEREAVAKRQTENAEAYQLYLKGLHHWRTFSDDGPVTSLNFYNAAIEKDPRFALAYSARADAYIVIGIYGPLPVEEAMGKARESAQTALKIDETLSEAHASLGAVKIFYERDWQGAEREFKRAIELAPDSVNGHNLYGYYLQIVGKYDEAVDELRKAAEIAPQWQVPMLDYLESLYIARRYDETISRSLEVRKLEPNNAHVALVLGHAYAQKGMYEEAAAEIRRGLVAAEGDLRDNHLRLRLLSILGYVRAVTGKRNEALEIVRQMRESKSRRKNFYLALVFTALGDKDQAFALLNEAYSELAFLWEVKTLPEFDSLRTDPRYVALLRRMNLDP